MKRIEELQIVDHRPLSASVHLFTLRSQSELPEIQAGQFVNIRIDKAPNVLLRRPISIHDCRPHDREIDLWIQCVGPGTQALSELPIGAYINLVYPLGNGFKIPNESERILLIGGGCGVAPLLLLSRSLHKAGHNVDIIIGGKSQSQILALDRYIRFAKTHPITEDGSIGQTGLVTQHSLLESQEFDRVYCCGPTPMMKAVARWAKNKSIPCQVSLENTMACGIGACLCCVTPTVEGHRCVCTDGPVFDADYILEMQ